MDKNKYLPRASEKGRLISPRENMSRSDNVTVEITLIFRLIIVTINPRLNTIEERSTFVGPTPHLLPFCTYPHT